tara:strand:+ start:467 stop:718 length:252 start_codon:yes stop_codon:yes gene_type:complete
MKKKFNKIVSPCISICQYDSENKCLGCMRTKDERVKWKKDETTDAWKNSNLEDIKSRMSDSFRESWEDTYEKKKQRIKDNAKT